MADIIIVLKSGKVFSVDNKRTNRFALVKGEVSRIKFVVVDANCEAEDLTGALFTFHAKTTKGGAADLSVVNASFDITNITTGIVYCPITTASLTHSTDYYCGLEIDLTGTSVDHSGDIILTINQPTVE